MFFPYIKGSWQSNLSNSIYQLHFVGNKAKGRISKRVFQESKARQIFRKTNIFYPPDTHTYVSGGKKCSFFGKFAVLCFLETPILRFAVLPYYRRFNLDRFAHAHPLLKTLNALNVYQINLLQVLLFIHKIKIKSSSRIFLHQFQTVCHKYATQYFKKNFKESKAEANNAKYCIFAHGRVI